MIETMFHIDTLDTSAAFLAALLIGLAFGFFLERAGFSSSRKLSGVFYFTDMTVIKVMFTAVMTALLGLTFVVSFGWISMDRIYLMPTVYGAHIVGGLIFGVGFVMGGWCPGTAAAGLACGKIDALIFLIGAVIGSALFNEMFAIVKPLYEAGQQGVVMVYDSLGMSPNAFILLLSVAAIAMFWGCEWIEQKTQNAKIPGNRSVLNVITVLLLVLPACLFIIQDGSAGGSIPVGNSSEAQLLASVEQAEDHIDPETLADQLANGRTDLIVVDVRPANEFTRFHIAGAMNVSLKDIHTALLPYKNKPMIVLYSNGMTHPAQARDSLYRSGFRNVYLLTDGLDGFIRQCLTPLSLRNEPMSTEMAQKIIQWRQFFLAPASSSISIQNESIPLENPLIDPQWLQDHLGQSALKIVDLRPQPEYNTAHLPGSLAVSPENLRTNINGVGSMLQPADMLARHLSLWGIQPTDTVIFIYGDKPHDATLASMALERLGHRRFGILNGGFALWKTQQKPLTTNLPKVSESVYPVSQQADDFTVDYQTILKHMQDKKTIIIDVRPADYYTGVKSDEARAGHIPGALNRPYTEDLVKTDEILQFKPIEELQKAYAQLIPSLETTVIIHCRTGHQASQTFFVLKGLLGYKNILWYDAGWSEWAARPELPTEK